jgi:predicted nuclease of restriction endonuclease-like (RecB) superfamily
VNRDLILLYWDIGRAIVEKQKTLGWGDSVVEMVAKDLRQAFPGARGFSANNVWLMRQFFSEYSSGEFLEQAVQEMRGRSHRLLEQAVPESAFPDRRRPSDEPMAVLEQLVQELLSAVPWGHHVELVKKIKTPPARLWYLQTTARLGWSRNVLLNQIKAGAY